MNRHEPSLAPGGTLVAARSGDGTAPAGATLVVFGPDGQARRPVAFNGNAAARAKEETAWWFHSGPWAVELVPFATAPELGLRLEFVIDTADPRLARQRFDLFLFSEIAGQGDALALPDLARRIEAALRGALAQGTVLLPPCTTLDEWNAFRAGLNELLYMRFGLTVDDCVPIDLADADYAAVLRRRAQALQAPPAAPAASTPAAAEPVLPGDAAALRRLFLELPEASRALRALERMPFAARQALLQRLALAALDVGTMPALAWSAPNVARPADEQRRLAGSSAAAVAALDELWALLAQHRHDGAGEDPERAVANLEFHLAARRGRAA